ncbi:MAG: hypothetical protein KA201_33550 [Kofleriaceae bacterium]|nr:hypothetical protein [Kofleriaceae bacterium]
MYEPRESKPSTANPAEGGGRRPAPGKSPRTARLTGTGPSDATAGADLGGGAPIPVMGAMPAMDDPFGLHLPMNETAFAGDDGVPPTDMFADQRAALADALERLIARAEWPALRPEARGAAAPGADGRAQARRRGEMPDLTGTGSVASMDTWARGLRVIASSWDGLDADQRKAALEQLATTVLTAADVPPAPIVAPETWRTQASFDFRKWRIVLLGSLLQRSPLTEEATCELAEVMAHEARHAEQYFLAARWLAGGGATAEEIVATIEQLPIFIAEQAVAIGTRGLSGPAMALASSMHQALGSDHPKHVSDAKDDGYDEMRAARDAAREVAARLRARPATATLEEGRAACENLQVSIAEVLRKYRVYRRSPYELDGHEVGAGAVAAFEASR